MNKSILILLSLVALGSIYLMNVEQSQVQTLHLSGQSNENLSVEEMITRINEKGSWKAKKYTRWMNMDKLGLEKINGAQERDRQLNLTKVNKVRNDIPNTFNASAQWPNCSSIGEIRDQANCGSDWAIAPASAITDRYCISRNQTVNPRISFETILTCSKSLNGCNGGNVDKAWKWWVDYGVVTGDGYQNDQWCQPYFLPPCGAYCPTYTAVAPDCYSSCVPQSNRTFKQDLYFGRVTYEISDYVQAIQSEIMTSGPVTANMKVYEDFFYYTSGVYVHRYGTKQGTRSVKILGWGQENGVWYWLCANSWSTQWGEKGFFKILLGYDECNIESNVISGLPSL